MDITADVELEQPMLGVRFISTTGWLTGPNGSFPIGFLAASYEEETLLFFTGLLPGELFFETDVEIENQRLGNAPLPLPDANHTFDLKSV